MSHSLFISDLHLCASRPHITEAFIAFLANTASQADALYILGDLFEYWAGDDAIATGSHAEVIQALHTLSTQGIAVFVMHGNRDFLLGEGFAKATGANLLTDPTTITLYGHPLLLSHGDMLCTADVHYQQFKTEVRTPAWQQQFLSQPLSERIAFIESVREKSQQEKSNKSMEIMDVNAEAVTELLSAYHYPTLIHGHTHRPMVHQHTIGTHTCTRWVLGDWYEQGSYLRVDQQGLHTHTL